MSAIASRVLTSILGPRVPEAELVGHAGRYAAPSLALLVARVLLLASLFVPYWQMTLKAPQYPQGLHVRAYLDRLEGDVAEIDSLNHYIGMRPLGEAAQFERETAVAATVASAGPGLILASVAAVLVVVGLYFHRRAFKPLVDARK